MPGKDVENQKAPLTEGTWMGVVATSYNAGPGEEDMLAQCRGQQTAREAPVEYLNKGLLTGFMYVGPTTTRAQGSPWRLRQITTVPKKEGAEPKTRTYPHAWTIHRFLKLDQTLGGFNLNAGLRPLSMQPGALRKIGKLRTRLALDQYELTRAYGAKGPTLQERGK